MDVEDNSPISVPRRVGPYQIRGTVGQGAFSTVKLAYCIDSKQYCACKVVPRARLLSHHLDGRFENEIRIIQQLRHPGIVQLFDLLKDDHNYYLIMEFCPNGELFSHIVERHHLPEKDAKVYLRQILEALEYVHSLGVAHRDLKPENILLDSYGKLKISDFGLSRFVGNSGLAETPCGSPCYAAPEVLTGSPYDGRRADVWSCGVILFAMVTGQLPWTKRNQTQLFEQIRNGEYTVPQYLSPECADLIRGLMCVNAEERLTIRQALSHKWMQLQVTGLSQLPDRFQRGTVSLRTVDRFFDREVSAQFDDIGVTLARSMSASARTIEEAMKEIRGPVRVSGSALRDAGSAVASGRRNPKDRFKLGVQR